MHLGKDGVAVGHYDLYDENSGEDLGRHAFYYSLADGFHDLGPLVDNRAEAGWLGVAYDLSRTDTGSIIGSGGFADSIGGVAAFMLKPVLQVQMNVDPWSTANIIKPNEPETVIPVVIEGATVASGGAIDFDATQIDPASLKFGIGEASFVNGPWFANWSGDANTDIYVGFETGDSAIACGDTEVMLTGHTFAGAPFEATDTIETVECETGGCHP